jgi:hypothetical protein
MEELARNHTADQLEVPEKRRQLWINRIKNRDLEIVRGIYLTNPELIEKKEGDALVRRVIRQYPELYKELERIAIYGWPDIYYEIYKNYMR